MIITGGCNAILLETKFERGLELFEGSEYVKKLTMEDVYSLGDFGFVDYAFPHNTSELSEEEIAELLYLGHMFKPLRSPFFEVLQNRFAYLSHDDGWYCKIFCRHPCNFFAVLFKKIFANSEMICEPPDKIMEQALQLATKGLLIDLEDTFHKDGIVEAEMYTVGDYSDMDSILNNFQQIKSGVSKNHILSCGKTEWAIS